jgi:hypothetical protein
MQSMRKVYPTKLGEDKLTGSPFIPSLQSLFPLGSVTQFPLGKIEPNYHLYLGLHLDSSLSDLNSISLSPGFNAPT